MTSWLQCLFLFAIVWSVGGTINGDSRKKFDAFFRLLISGTDKDHPKPKNIKLTKVCGSQFSTVSQNRVCCSQRILLNRTFCKLSEMGRFLEMLVDFWQILVHFWQMLVHFFEVLVHFLEMLVDFWQMLVHFLQMLVHFFEVLVHFLEMLAHFLQMYRFVLVAAAKLNKHAHSHKKSHKS